MQPTASPVPVITQEKAVNTTQQVVAQNDIEPQTSEPSHQVVVSHFMEDTILKQSLFKTAKLPILVGILVIVILSLSGGSYALYQHESKDSSALASNSKSNPVTSSLNQTATTSPTASNATPTTSSTPSTSSSSPTISTPSTSKSATNSVKATSTTSIRSSSSSPSTTSSPAIVAFSATASAPVFTNQGSYASTSINSPGLCSFNYLQSYSVNGPGSVSLNDFQSTNDPNNGPNDASGYGNQTFTQVGSASVSNPVSFSTSYGSHVIVSDYFQVVNIANGKVIATSPTAQFDCP